LDAVPGISVMVRTKKLALERGFHVSFRAPQQEVENVLRLSGLKHYLLGDGA
jgi:hypothetical protein